MISLADIHGALARSGLLGGLCVFGFGQGAVLTTVFWRRESGDVYANRLLAALIFAATLHLGEMFFWVTGLLGHFPWLGSVSYPAVYLVAPFYWFYLRRTLDVEARVTRRDWWHFLPALVVFGTLLPSYLYWPTESKIAYYEALADRAELPVSGSLLFFTAFGALQSLAYLVFSWRRLGRAKRTVDSYAADAAAERGLRTMRRIALVYGVYVVLHLAIFVLVAFIGFYHLAADTLWLVAAVSFVSAHAVAAIGRPDSVATIWWEAEANAVQAKKEEPELAIVPEPPAKPKYERSKLSDARVEEIQERLEAAMEEEHLYRDGALTLRKVALRLELKPHHVSQVLNRALGKTFFDFVNDYRIEEAKRRLAEPGRATILEIALESGFNHKSTFNEAFRARTGTTPSAWRRENVA